MEEQQYTQTIHTEDFIKAVLSGAWLFESMGHGIAQKELPHGNQVQCGSQKRSDRNVCA